ncbi:disease resistance protein RUN1 [Quercus suber]|uniref:disease resistance protein RUN1 n=1 Tax=Quercus suber TaxID=58331 RepID=UPI0032DF6E90
MASTSTQRAHTTSSSSSSSTSRRKYDVFLSFCGKDTRTNFTDHLYSTLEQKGIHTFRDNEKLEQGTFIAPELTKAIKESKYAIIVLSENYAFSKWCLDELVKILECMNEKELKVLPIFYHVDPSDIRNQRKTFEKAFLEHEKDPKVSIETIQLWKAALTEVGKIVGEHINDSYESGVVEKISKRILNELNHELPFLPRHLVGIDYRVEKIMNLFGSELDDVRFIGIWGMAGIGKTTLAHVIYNRICHQFEANSFISNVRETAKKNDLVYLQQLLLSKILMEREVTIQDHHMGIQVIRRRLYNKKLLIVIDDVDDYEQLQALAGSRSWFGPGSRIIITSRVKTMLDRLCLETIYTVKGLDNDEALELFSWKAFEKPYPEENFLELSNDFVKYAKGLPLALKVLGSSLFGKSIDAWKSNQEKLKGNPKKEILDTLKIGFDGLEDMHKNLFLDLACFFKGEDKDRLANILKDYDYDMGIEILMDKSLITIFGGKLLMHDLIQEMGWKIASESELGRRRLFSYEDISHVLENEKGIELVHGLKLSLPSHQKEQLNATSFSMMKRLRLLIIHNIHLPQGLSYLSNELRLLQWNEYPLKSLPKSFQPKKLVELIMHHSGIERLPKGFSNLQELKLMDLSNSQYLIETPNFIGFSKLERLIFQGCIRLCALHSSVGALKQLTLLNLKDCKNIKSLPREINLESLKIFILSGCSRLKKFSEIGKNMTRLWALYLDETAIEELPVSIEHLTGLTLLSLQDCKSFWSFPGINLPSLKDLNLTGCKGQPSKSWHSHALSLLLCLAKILGIDSFFPALHPKQEPINLLHRLSGLSSIERLNLSDCNLSDEAPLDDLSCLSSLQFLDLSKNEFTRLPDSFSQLSKLISLELNDCSRLQSLPILSPTTLFVHARGCTSLESYSNELGTWTSEEGFCLLDFLDNRDLSHFAGSYYDYYQYDQMWKKCLKESGSDLCANSLRNTNRSEIPEWFCHQSPGSSISIPLPCNLQDNITWKGVSILAMFEAPKNLNDISPIQKFNFYSIITSDFDRALGRRCCPLVFQSYHELPFVATSYEYHELISAADLRDHLQECSRIRVMIISDRPDIEFKMCGVRILYEQDLVEVPRVLFGWNHIDIGSSAKYQSQVVSGKQGTKPQI